MIQNRKKRKRGNRSIRDTQYVKDIREWYCICNGVLFYNYYGRIFFRKMIPEIGDLFERKIMTENGYFGHILYEHEMSAINRYILCWDNGLNILDIKPHIIRTYGKVEILNGEDPIVFGSRYSELVKHSNRI